MAIRGLSQRFVDFKDQFVYRPGINPFHAKISKVALNIIFACTFVACIAYAKFAVTLIVPIAVISALAAWIFPLVFQPDPNKILTECGITEDDIEKFQLEAKNNQFDLFKIFLESLSSDIVKKLMRTRLFPVLCRTLERGMEGEKIPKDLLQKLTPIFRKRGVFNPRNFPSNIEIVASDGKKFQINKFILFMSSSYFKNLLHSEFEEGKKKSITFPKLSSTSVGGLLHFFNTGELPDELNIDECAQLYDFSHMAFMDDLSKSVVKKIGSLTVECQTQATLEKFLQAFSKYSKPSKDSLIVFDPKVIHSVIAKAFTVFFKKNYGASGSCQLTEGTFTVPLKALNLVKANNIIGECLRCYANCVTLDSSFTGEDLDSLKVLSTVLDSGMKEKINSLNIPFSLTSFKIEINKAVKDLLSLFPTMTTVYCSPAWYWKPMYNTKLLLETLKGIAGSNITKRVLIVDNFDPSEQEFQHVNFEFDAYDTLKQIFDMLTDIENFREKTRMMVPKRFLDYGIRELGMEARIRSKIRKPIKKVSFEEISERYENIYSISVEYQKNYE